jgi:hypothetical protein
MLPSKESIQDIARSHKSDEVALINQLTTFTGRKIKDAADKGKFFCIVTIPAVVLFQPVVDPDITITVISKRLRSLGYKVRRIEGNRIAISWSDQAKTMLPPSGYDEIGKDQRKRRNELFSMVDNPNNQNNISAISVTYKKK